MSQLPDQAVVPHDKIPENLPDNVPDRVSKDAESGYDQVNFSRMRVEDAYDDTWVVMYRWDADELSQQEAEDLFDLIEGNHTGYDDSRLVETNAEWVIRLDYTD